MGKKALLRHLTLVERRLEILEGRTEQMQGKLWSLQRSHSREPMTHATFTVTTGETPEETTISTETRPETEEEINTRVGHDHKEK